MQTLLEKLREKIKDLLMQDHNMLLLAAVIGFLAGLASTLFRRLIEFFEVIFSSDGLVTSTKNISLVVKTADCMPVLIKTESSIAALHVGWKGLQNDIFNLALRKITGTNIKVSVGPHAQSCCYEIQNDVAQLFPKSVLKRKDKIYLNLSEQIVNFCQLNDIEIQVSKNCTVCDNNFWSFRENKTAQRQYSFIWI